MNLHFDHIVHYLNEPNKVIKKLADKGIHAVPGGAHRNRPTFNTLSYFDLSYIEYIGTTNKQALQEMEHPPYSMINTIIKSGFKEGFARFIIATDDIEKVAANFTEKKVNIEGPVYLSRERPDGSLLEWQLLFVGDESEGLELPYFIQWNENRDERRADLKEKEVIVEHPAKTTFSHIKLAVNDLDKTIKKWSYLLQLEVGEKYFDEKLHAKCQALFLPGGNLIFATPNGPGIVKDILEKEGEKPFQVNINSTKRDDFFEMCGGRYKITKIKE